MVTGIKWLQSIAYIVYNFIHYYDGGFVFIN